MRNEITVLRRKQTLKINIKNDYEREEISFILLLYTSFHFCGYQLSASVFYYQVRVGAY